MFSASLAGVFGGFLLWGTLLHFGLLSALRVHCRAKSTLGRRFLELELLGGSTPGAEHS